MDTEKFTQKVIEALQQAVGSARERQNLELTPWHLLSELSKQDATIFNGLLEAVNRSVDEVSSVDIRPSNDFIRLIESAEKEAKKFKDTHVSTEHVLLAAIKNGLISISYDDIKEHLESVRGGKNVMDQNPEDKQNVLEKYGQDFTELAKSGKLDPVIKR